MPSEAKRFVRVDKSWKKSQHQAFEIKSVLQCCLGSSSQENTRRILLKDVQKELEICFKALNSYLNKKRHTFPRYYLLSNSSLLTLLRHSNSENSELFQSIIVPLVSCLFSNISIINIEKETKMDQTYTHAAINDSQLDFNNSMKFNEQQQQQQQVDWSISSVATNDGDILNLIKKLSLEKGPETWIPRLKDSISESIKTYIDSAFNNLNDPDNFNVEELAANYPTQICLLCLHQIYTRDIEATIIELKNERKAIASSKKILQIMARLNQCLIKSRWIHIDRPILALHRIRMEAMTMVINIIIELIEMNY
jgi:dynein heavy chain, axonemal